MQKKSKIVNIEKLLIKLKWKQQLENANDYSCGYRDGHNDTLDQVISILLKRTPDSLSEAKKRIFFNEGEIAQISKNREDIFENDKYIKRREIKYAKNKI